MRRPSAWSMRVRSVIGMPGRPKTVSMPFSFSASMTQVETVDRFLLRGRGAATGRRRRGGGGGWR